MQSLCFTDLVLYRVESETTAVSLDKVVVMMTTSSALIVLVPMHMDHQMSLEVEVSVDQEGSVANLATKTIPSMCLNLLLV